MGCVLPAPRPPLPIAPLPPRAVPALVARDEAAAGWDVPGCRRGGAAALEPGMRCVGDAPLAPSRPAPQASCGLRPPGPTGPAVSAPPRPAGGPARSRPHCRQRRRLAKFGKKAAGRARPVPFAGLRLCLAALRRLHASSTCATASRRCEVATATQRLEDALLLLALMVELLQKLPHVPRHGRGRMARRTSATSAAVVMSSRQRPFTTSSASASAHGTLGRVVMREQLSRCRHPEERPRRSSAAALAAVPGRFRRPLRRRRGSLASGASSESRQEPARGGGERHQRGAAAVHTADGRARVREARRATAQAVTALEWASPPVIANGARTAAEWRPTPIAANKAHREPRKSHP
jgi:hypothetical protein